jgi:hypothetical protein
VSGTGGFAVVAHPVTSKGTQPVNKIAICSGRDQLFVNSLPPGNQHSESEKTSYFNIDPEKGRVKQDRQEHLDLF